MSKIRGQGHIRTASTAVIPLPESESASPTENPELLTGDTQLATNQRLLNGKIQSTDTVCNTSLRISNPKDTPARALSTLRSITPHGLFVTVVSTEEPALIKVVQNNTPTVGCMYFYYDPTDPQPLTINASSTAAGFMLNLFHDQPISSSAQKITLNDLTTLPSYNEYVTFVSDRLKIKSADAFLIANSTDTEVTTWITRLRTELTSRATQ